MRIFLLMGLIACGEKEEAPDLLNSGTESTSCGDTAPEIQAVVCENSGIKNHPDYGEIPTFTLRTTVYDADGNLTYYQLFVDFDAVLDGVEDELDTQMNPVDGAIDGDSCDVTDASIGMTIYLNGNKPTFDTTYEWYVRVTDASGNISEPYMVECTTPDENGDGEP